MRRLTVGAASAVLAFLATALAADAQISGQPYQPLCVASDAPSSVYKTLVTTGGNFYCRLRVYLNGVLKHDTNTLVTTSGPTYDFSKTVSHTNWNMQSGNSLNYRGRVTLQGTSYWDQDDWIITVSSPGTCRVTDGLFVDRDRRNWA